MGVRLVKSCLIFFRSENERVNIPGLPTSLPSDLTHGTLDGLILHRIEQIESYIIHMRIEELGRKLRIGDYIPAEKK